MLFRQIICGHSDQLMPFARGDRFACRAAGVPNSGFDFHKNQRGAVASDNVDFATSGTVASVKNCVPSTAQRPAGQLLSVLSQQYAMICRQGPFLLATRGPGTNAVQRPLRPEARLARLADLWETETETETDN